LFAGVLRVRRIYSNYWANVGFVLSKMIDGICIAIWNVNDNCTLNREGTGLGLCYASTFILIAN